MLHCAMVVADGGSATIVRGGLAAAARVATTERQKKTAVLVNMILESSGETGSSINRLNCCRQTRVRSFIRLVGADKSNGHQRLNYHVYKIGVSSRKFIAGSVSAPVCKHELRRQISLGMIQ